MFVKVLITIYVRHNNIRCTWLDDQGRMDTQYEYIKNMRNVWLDAGLQW